MWGTGGRGAFFRAPLRGALKNAAVRRHFLLRKKSAADAAVPPAAAVCEPRRGRSVPETARVGENAMNDSDIVRLIYERDEFGLKAAGEKYRSYCMKIAENITGSREDAEECVNDVFMKAWELIPPNKPELLSAFLGKLTRNIAINRRKRCMAEKRGRGEAALAYEELNESIKGGDNVEEEFDRRELSREINAFLESLPEHKRNIFIRRYWYCDSVKTIAAEWGMTRTAVSVTLHRLRDSLCEHLRKRGYDV